MELKMALRLTVCLRFALLAQMLRTSQSPKTLSAMQKTEEIAR